MEWFLIALALVVIWFVITYNGLVKLRNRVDNAWGQVEVQLQRRYDLIPNLVQAVKGYASHESETFEKVITARNRAADATGPAAKADADNVLTGMLRQLFALAEDYPDLRASENFQDLQGQLAETEDKVSVARQIYNDSTLTFNNKVQTIPSNIVASITGFSARDFFDAPSDADQAPRVEF